MSKQVSDEVAKEVTFHTCLLQVIQNRTEDLSNFPQFYFQDVKQKGNLFKKAIDKRLDAIYGNCGEQEIEQADDLINFIADKLDEAWEYYQQRAKREEI